MAPKSNPFPGIFAFLYLFIVVILATKIMEKNDSTFKQVGFASIIMMASVFASRIIGLGREMTIAFSGGAGGEVDAYQVAFIVPEILNHIVASGFFRSPLFPSCRLS